MMTESIFNALMLSFNHKLRVTLADILNKSCHAFKPKTRVLCVNCDNHRGNSLVYEKIMTELKWICKIYCIQPINQILKT